MISSTASRTRASRHSSQIDGETNSAGGSRAALVSPRPALLVSSSLVTANKSSIQVLDISVDWRNGAAQLSLDGNFISQICNKSIFSTWIFTHHSRTIRMSLLRRA
jgi:hypothetical protein